MGSNVLYFGKAFEQFSLVQSYEFYTIVNEDLNLTVTNLANPPDGFGTQPDAS